MNHKQVVLNNSVFSKDSKSLERLNEITALHQTYSPGLLMTYTGCNLRDALYVLYLLFDYSLAEIFLLIYDKRNADHLIQRRHISRGLPKIPFDYETDDGTLTINQLSDMYYTLEFDLVPNIEITFVGNASE